MKNKILQFVGITLLLLGMSITSSNRNINETSIVLKTNNPPYEPSNPIPPNGAENWTLVILCWTGGDPDGDSVTYDIYFGNTTPPNIIEYNWSSTCYDGFSPGFIELNTTYYWKIVSWDEHGALSEGPIWNFKTRGNKPPSAPEIKVHKGDSPRKYYITIKSTDPDGDNVFYFIDWGDGTFIDCLGPYKSGENVTITHSWPPVTKLYELHAMAKDIYGAESNWVKVYIFILKTRLTSLHCFFWILERFPLLERLLNYHI